MGAIWPATACEAASGLTRPAAASARGLPPVRRMASAPSDRCCHLVFCTPVAFASTIAPCSTRSLCLPSPRELNRTAGQVAVRLA